jgi:hypothetical protein
VAKAAAQRNAALRWDAAAQLQKALAFDWQSEPLAKCEERLATLLASFNEGSTIIKQRHGAERAGNQPCHTCNSTDYKRPISIITIHDPKTHLPKNLYFCKVSCYELYRKELQTRR